MSTGKIVRLIVTSIFVVYNEAHEVSQCRQGVAEGSKDSGEQQMRSVKEREGILCFSNGWKRQWRWFAANKQSAKRQTRQ